MHRRQQTKPAAVRIHDKPGSQKFVADIHRWTRKSNQTGRIHDKPYIARDHVTDMHQKQQTKSMAVRIHDKRRS